MLISQVSGSDKLLFSYDANGNVVAVNYNGTYYYYVRNGQNDVIRLIDGNNNSVVEYSYDSWGKQISCTGSLASTLGAQNPFRYRGYVYDPDTGLYYLQTRYYDPEVGRFINADIYMSNGQGVLGNNMYLYCLNNPVNMLDSEGTIGIFLGAVIAVSVATFVGAMVSGMRSTSEGGSFLEGAVSGAITSATTAIGIAAVTCSGMALGVPIILTTICSVVVGEASAMVGSQLGYRAEIATNEWVRSKSKDRNYIEREYSEAEAKKRLKSAKVNGMLAGFFSGVVAADGFISNGLGVGIYSYVTSGLVEVLTMW